MAATKYKSRRLSILLVASCDSRRGDLFTVGQTEPSLSDSEFVDYVELLSACNLNFDIVHPDEISPDIFITRGTINYAVVIVTVPHAQLTDVAVEALKEASKDMGVSLISSYSNADERTKLFFGIREFLGKKPLWPLKVRIIHWPRDIYNGKTIIDYGVNAGLLGYRKRGLKKLSLTQTLLKVFRLALSMVLPYVRVTLNVDTLVLATNFSSEPLAWSYQYGNATNYYFALHSDLFLDKYNGMHCLVRSAIEANSGFGMVSVDLEKTMVLRLDDPGACSGDYLSSHSILEKHDWEKLGELLRKKELPLTVMYTPGWVDDGDKKTGKLFVGNKEVTNRPPGRVYHSPLVKYITGNRKSATYDHSSEFTGIRKLVEAGLVDVQSHGHTHLNPDHQTWAESANRHKSSTWYHEFYHVAKGRKICPDKQRHSMVTSRELIKNLFGLTPCALSPSGHRHDSICDVIARDVGYSLFSADFTGVCKPNILIRNWKIPSIFLFMKEPSSSALVSGYPSVAVLHDYELKKKGLGSLKSILTNGLQEELRDSSTCESYHSG